MQSDLDNALSLIRAHYKGVRAKRSGVRLMAHITEGISILEDIHASEETRAAFAIHPLVQSDEMLLENITYLVPRVSTAVLSLALQYRDAANAYLCKEATDHLGMFAIRNLVRHEDPRVLQMLYADKKQNQKDFRLYHQGQHERSDELAKYFKTWLDALKQHGIYE